MKRQAGYATVVAGVGERLKLIREVYGARQSDVAEALGMAPSTIESWEGERNIISLPALIQTAQRFAVSPIWLATGRGAIFALPAAAPALLVLGDHGHPAPCRAAAHLLAGSPLPLTVALIHQNYKFGARWGWVFVQPDWTTALGLILPGEEAPAQKDRAIRRFLAAGHRLLGQYELKTQEAARFEQMTPGVIDDAAFLAHWTTRLAERPHVTDFRSVVDLSQLPPAEAQLVQAKLEALAAAPFEPPVPTSPEGIAALLRERPDLLRAVRETVAGALRGAKISKRPKEA